MPDWTVNNVPSQRAPYDLHWSNGLAPPPPDIYFLRYASCTPVAVVDMELGAGTVPKPNYASNLAMGGGDRPTACNTGWADNAVPYLMCRSDGSKLAHTSCTRTIQAFHKLLTMRAAWCVTALSQGKLPPPVLSVNILPGAHERHAPVPPRGRLGLGPD